MFCEKCGSRIDDSAKACPACGALVGSSQQTTFQLQQVPAPVQAAPNTALSGGKRNVVATAVAIIAATAVVVVIVMVIVTIAFGSPIQGKSPSESANALENVQLHKESAVPDLVGTTWKANIDGEDEYLSFMDDGKCLICSSASGIGLAYFYDRYSISGDEIVFEGENSAVAKAFTTSEGRYIWQDDAIVFKVDSDPDGEYARDYYSYDNASLSLSDVTSSMHAFVGNWEYSPTLEIRDDGTWRQGTDNGIWMYLKVSGKACIVTVDSSGSFRYFTYSNGNLVEQSKQSI